MQVLYWNHAATPLFVCAALIRSSRSANVMEFSHLVHNPSTASAISMDSLWAVNSGTLFCDLTVKWYQLNSTSNCHLAPLLPTWINIYPVHGANLTLIQPMWSAYPYAPTSLYGIHMPLLPYMVIQPIVLGMALLWAAIDSALSQGPLLWRHNDMTVIVSRNTRGRERDTRQRLDNANARRLQTVNR